MRLLITEKPSFAKAIGPLVRERWPVEDIIMMSSIPYWLNRYAYPRGLPYNDYPLLGNQKYARTENRLEDGSFAQAVSLSSDGTPTAMRVCFDQACEWMRNAEHLVFAGDWDHTGVWGMERMLELLAPERDATDYDVAVFNGGLDEASIRRVLSDLRRPSDERFVAMSNAAQVKRYFDYNFNVNSLPILGNLYRSIAGTNDPVLISKYMVQLLLFVVKHGDEGTLNGDWLANWKGTGKYKPEDNEWFMSGIGSPASRLQMMKQLEELELIQACATKSVYGMAYRCTPMGLVFAGRLHKDCSDPDLPFRLQEWMGQPFDEIRPVIDKYLLTFFRRQKRHQAV